MGGYIRGQLVLGLVVGTIVAVGLLALGIPFAVVLGIVAGLTELVPIIGPWIGGGVGVLVTLATEPDKILYVILLYLVIQMLENTLLVPRIQGETLNLRPRGRHPGDHDRQPLLRPLGGHPWAPAGGVGEGHHHLFRPAVEQSVFRAGRSGLARSI